MFSWNLSKKYVGCALTSGFLMGSLLQVTVAHAVVNGIEIQHSSPSPYVGLDFILPGLSEPDICSGSYLGAGKFLTAAHCFILNEYQTDDLQVCIYGRDKVKRVCAGRADFSVSLPPVLELGSGVRTRKSKAPVQIPRPDMAIFQVSEPLIEQLGFLSSVRLNFDEVPGSAEKAIVGQGCAHYARIGEVLQDQGVLRSGAVVLETEASPLEWFSVWLAGSKNAGVCWGDSGGALIAFIQGEWSQIGVVSGTSSKYDYASGMVNLVRSVFSRLDPPEVQKWFKQNR